MQRPDTNGGRRGAGPEAPAPATAHRPTRAGRAPWPALPAPTPPSLTAAGVLIPLTAAPLLRIGRAPWTAVQRTPASRHYTFTPASRRRGLRLHRSLQPLHTLLQPCFAVLPPTLLAQLRATPPAARPCARLRAAHPALQPYLAPTAIPPAGATTR